MKRKACGRKNKEKRRRGEQRESNKEKQGKEEKKKKGREKGEEKETNKEGKKWIGREGINRRRESGGVIIKR